MLLTVLLLPGTSWASSGARFSAGHPQILVGKWGLDLKRSSLGTDPYEQFDAWTLTFTQVTATTLAWTAVAIVHGKKLIFSWAGPINGSAKPLIGIEGADAYRWHENTLVRESDLGHGEKKRDTVTISRDGQTMIIRDRSSTPQGVVRATLIMHREK